MVDFRIDVVVDPSRAAGGARVVERELTRVENRADSLRLALSRAFQVIGVTALTKQLLGLADAYTTVQNKIRNVTNGEAELNAVTDRLFQTANDTRASFEGTATIYTRLAASAKDLGRSQEELIQFARGLNQVIATNGVTATEASNALIQLSQGLGSGALRGDEFRSVSEQIPGLLRLIAEEAGVSVGELKKLGAEGKITADLVFRAVLKSSEALEKGFAKSIPTVGQALTVLRNNLLKFVGESDKSIGATRGLAQAILFVAQNAEVFARTVIGAAVALATVFVGRGINSAIAGLARLGVAVLTNPLTALPAIIAVAVGAIVAFGDQVRISSEGLATIADVGIEGLKVLGEAFAQLGDIVAGALGGLGLDFDISFKGILLTAAQTVDGIVGFFSGAFNAIGAIYDSLGASASAAGQLILKGFRDGLEAVIDFTVATVQTIGDILRRAFTNINNAIAASATSLGALSVGKLEAAQSAAEDAAAAVRLIGISVLKLPDEVRSNQVKLQATDFLPTVDISQEAVDLGKTVATEFDRGFAESTGAMDVVNRVFDSAEQRAQERADRQRKEAEEREKARAALSTPGTAPKGGKFDEENVKAIENLLKRVELQKALNEQFQILNERFPEGQRGTEEYSKALEALQLKALEASTTLEAGFGRAFLKIKQEAEDLAAVGEKIANVFADQATNALIEFAQTGEFNFKKFASSVLEEITKILIRLLVVQAISAALGGTGGAIGNAALGAGAQYGGQRAGGGDVMPGHSYLVGENGPEMFTPDRAGTITPNSQLGTQEAPQVNLQVVNVDDPNKVPQAISSGSADDAILNVLAKNKDRVNQIIR